MVETITENRKNYSNQQYECAKQARKLYHGLGAPSVKIFKGIICANMIKNCPITIEDINNAEDIFGQDISYLKGKTTRRNLTPTRKDEIKIPNELSEKHKNIKLHIDKMYINGIGFLTSISHPTYYRTCDYIESNSAVNFYKTLDKILRKHNKGGF